MNTSRNVLGGCDKTAFVSCVHVGNRRCMFFMCCVYSNMLSDSLAKTQLRCATLQGAVARDGAARPPESHARRGPTEGSRPCALAEVCVVTMMIMQLYMRVSVRSQHGSLLLVS